MAVHFQPTGYHTITPYLIIRGAAAAIDYYKKVFGAIEVERIPGPDGLVGHAEIKIGDTIIMLADEVCNMNKSPEALGGSPISLLIYVKDADAIVNGAVAAGGKLIRPVADQFYGDRMGGITDPFGHAWFIGTHIEDVPADELARRAAAMHATK